MLGFWLMLFAIKLYSHKDIFKLQILLTRSNLKQRKRFADVSRRDDQKYEVFKTAWRVVKTNEDIGDQCIKYDIVMTFSDKIRK